MSAAPDLKRVTLELGGNDPAIILDDADPAVVSRAIVRRRLQQQRAGLLGHQAGLCPEALHDDVVEALAGYASTVKVGDGTDPESKLGPINNEPQYERVKSWWPTPSRAGLGR